MDEINNNEQQNQNSLVLRTEGLVKRYGKRTVANGVSINVKQGEIVGLLVERRSTPLPMFRIGFPELLPCTSSGYATASRIIAPRCEIQKPTFWRLYSMLFPPWTATTPCRQILALAAPIELFFSPTIPTNEYILSYSCSKL